MTPASDVRIAGSLLAAPPAQRLRAARRLTTARHRVHVDVVDHTYPIGVGVDPALVGTLTAERMGPVDVHLLVAQPRDMALDALDHGADRVTVQLEAVDDREVEAIGAAAASHGAEFWVAADVATPLSALADYLGAVDGVLAMLAPAGTSGTSADLRRLDEIACIATSTVVGVDGGVEPGHLPRLVAAGVREAVIGRALVGRFDEDTARKGASQ